MVYSYFRNYFHDERRRPRRDAPAADQWLENLLNFFFALPCLKEALRQGILILCELLVNPDLDKTPNDKTNDL